MTGVSAIYNSSYITFCIKFSVCFNWKSSVFIIHSWGRMFEAYPGVQFFGQIKDFINCWSTTDLIISLKSCFSSEILVGSIINFPPLGVEFNNCFSHLSSDNKLSLILCWLLGWNFKLESIIIFISHGTVAFVPFCNFYWINLFQVQWLMDNYETAEGVSLPRSTLYNHYLRHCNQNKLDPMNPASFGKLIRSVFLGLRTRRLGTR